MNKKYYIFVGNEKIEVDQKIYQNYWQITNRENYLERLDRKSKLLFFSNLSSEYPCEESLVDETVNVEKIVETQMMLQAVREAISELNEYSGAAEPLFRKSGNRLSGIGNRRAA